MKQRTLALAFLLAVASPAFALTELTGIVAISAGGYHTCAITADGGVKCWGANDFGQLGDGTKLHRYLPVDVVGLDEKVTAISAGGTHTCAVLESGRLKCWGSNSARKASISRNVPAADKYLFPVDALDPEIGVLTVTAGEIQTCAVTDQASTPPGAVMCWGYATSGLQTSGATSVGLGTLSLPVSPHVPPVTYYSTCALVAGGVQCWGNASGDYPPAPVEGLTSGVKALSMGGWRACAITAGNGVTGWTPLGSPPAGYVTGLANNVAAVSVGTEFLCALTTAGGVKCQGYNGYGQLGAIEPTDQSLRDVPGLTSGVAAISSGRQHACALLSSGSVRCWGDNYYGQVGHGGALTWMIPPSAVVTGVPSRLANLSTRAATVTADDVTIAGFVVSGSSPKTVVVRGLGPSLANYGVGHALPNPTLQLVRMADNATVATNDDWQSSPDAAQVSGSGLAPSHPLESAIYATLQPGAYTAILSGGSGVGLVEVYEVDHPETPLINLSTRAKVGTGFDLMIAGFVVSGETPQMVLVSAIGPSLANYGVADVLANPSVQIVRLSDNTVIATNDNWGNALNAYDIQASGLAPPNGFEAAILIRLTPGAYTAIVSGEGDTTGVALVEVYAQ
jgi:hypothetical protein